VAFVAGCQPDIGDIGRGTLAWREQAGVIVWYAELADVLAIKTLWSNRWVTQCRWVAGVRHLSAVTLVDARGKREIMGHLPLDCKTVTGKP
jgi:hypothetical protein